MPGPLARHVADAHVHLFNAADLPVVKFVEYVVLPEWAPGSPDWAAAILDIFLTVVKSLVVTARQEAGSGDSRSVSAAGDPSPELFGQRVAERASAVIVAADNRDARANPALAESYRQLAMAVAADAGGPGQPVDRAAATSSVILRRTFTITARRAEGLDPVQPGATVELDRNGKSLSWATAVRIVAWAYLMCLSRRTHLHRYLAQMSAAPPVEGHGARPQLLLNHLVDYDRWLGDGPSRGSAATDQIAVLTRIAADPAETAAIKTFAGFCPLKNAMETLEAAGPTSLDGLKAAFLRGDIKGFKIYPPMGFWPLGNAGRPNTDYAAAGGIGDSVVRRWQALRPRQQLGDALEAALNGFYAWCATHDAPLMAHAGPGNQAAPGFGLRANPTGWEKVLAAYPAIRLNMAHLVASTAPFVAQVNGQPLPPDTREGDLWALDAPLRMLRTGGSAYGDLAYMPEIANDRALASAFFTALKSTFGPADPGLRHILYGSDWIMVAQEKNTGRYLEAMITGMRDAAYTDDEIENICWANAQRYMKL